MYQEYQRIVAATDFSSDAEYALATAVDLAGRYQARLYCLHVLFSPYSTLPDDPALEPVRGKDAKISEEILEKTRRRLIGEVGPKTAFLSIPCVFHVAWGIPFVEIIRFARSEGADLIVIGAVGTSKLKHLSFGSTAENVARRAHCAVLVTRDPQTVY